MYPDKGHTVGGRRHGEYLSHAARGAKFGSWPVRDTDALDGKDQGTMTAAAQAATDSASVCSICGAGADADSPLHKCSGCSLVAHPECFSPAPRLAGADGAPATSVRCPVCSSGSPAATCSLCYGTGGAMLRTQEGQWVHGVCALYTPGVSLAAAEGAEDAASWLAVGVPGLLTRAAAAPSVCAVCSSKCGACAPCASPGCGEAVHPSCALRQGLRLGSVTHFGAERYFVLCPRHTAADTPAHEPTPVARADTPVDEMALGPAKASGLTQSQEDEFAEEVSMQP